MTNTASIQDLSKRIEEVVQEHIATSHRVAAAALERAFAKAAAKPSAATRTRRGVAESGGARRRAPQEVSAIGERLYQAVCAKPGAAMTVLAADVGATPRDLNRPMMHLKRAGKIRSVGQRHLTRYFPLVGEGTACS
jgi:hypothetical protein